MRRSFLLVVALFVLCTAGASAQEPPETLQVSQPATPALTDESDFPPLPPVLVATSKFIDGAYVVPDGLLFFSADAPRRGSTMIAFYRNDSCSGSPYRMRQRNLDVQLNENQFVASVRGLYDFTLDDGSIVHSYHGPCLKIIGDAAKYYGVGAPATPIADPDGSTPSDDVVALPNTGAGQNDGTPFLWFGIGAAILASGFALRWRASR